MSRLEDKVVVIVGGTSGLGRSAAAACLSAGARVMAVGRSAASCAAIERELGECVRTLPGDAREPDTAERAIAAAREQFGGFDALYHVAGGSGRGRGDGPLDQITDQGWSYTLDTNLTSVFHSNRAAVADWLAHRRGGSVLNMGSVLADAPSARHFATHAYAAAKAGIVGLTRAAAAYYAGRQIRFNVIAPALVETPMSTRAAADAEIMQYVRAKQPLDGGRIGQPEDLDAAVVFLLSDESRFITGQVLKVDGGWSVSDGVPNR